MSDADNVFNESEVEGLLATDGGAGGGTIPPQEGDDVSTVNPNQDQVDLISIDRQELSNFLCEDYYLNQGRFAVTTKLSENFDNDLASIQELINFNPVMVALHSALYSM